MTTITCPDCQTVFSCDATGDNTCWCNDYPAVMPVAGSQTCRCPACLATAIAKQIEDYIRSTPDNRVRARPHQDDDGPIEHIDYTIESGQLVFTRWYHLKRGTCCGNGCRYCPYVCR